MSDTQMIKFLEGVQGVVECDRYGSHMLWDSNQRRDNPKTWVSDNSGLMHCVGHVGDDPVWISLFKADVGGVRVLFLEATSQVVDHRMIDDWMLKTLPKTAIRDDGYVNKTDPTNFHIIFHNIEHRMMAAAEAA